LAAQPKSGEINQLIGQNYYGLGDYKKATQFFEAAFAQDGSNSVCALWLGRAYGRRAETSSPITAPGYASKARQFFERAVQLDPKNSDALNDLFEYYLEAPGFLGGGYDKAAQLAERIAANDSAEGHWAQARLAEKRKEFHSAEDQLRRAMDVAPHQVGRVIDLARFLSKQGRYQESDQSFARAQKMEPDSPKVLFARAETYIASKRNLNVARALLEKYLTARLSPEDPPRSEAQKLLRQVKGS
jgi:tetratricopeptide (TPR) repeat protein